MKTTIRMKGILTAALTACLFSPWGIGGLHAQVTVIDSGYCGASGDTNLVWFFTSDSVLSIYGSGDMANYTSSTMPWYSYRNQIQMVIVGDSVGSIGEYTFYNYSSLTSVIIGKSVKRIEIAAFYNCSNLASLTVYAANPPVLFGTTVLYNVDTTILIYVPCGCIPVYKSNWGWIKFSNYDDRLTAPIIQGTCGAQGGNLRWQLFCNGDTLVISGSGDMANYQKTPPWYSYRNQIKTVIIGDSVTSIGEDAFCDCSNITSIKIYTAYVLSIGYSSFTYVPVNTISVHVLCGMIPFYQQSSRWKNFGGFFEIPNVTTIQGTCGAQGDNLTWQLSLCDSGVLTISGSGDMEDYPTDRSSPWYRSYPIIKKIIIGDSVTSIGIYAFAYSRNISITIPDNVTTIGNAAFISSEVRSVTMGKNLTTIKSHAFYYCQSLTSVMLGNNVTTIEGWAFDGCSGLDSIVIPHSVLSLGERAFSACQRLVYASIGDGINSIRPRTFASCSSLSSLTIGKNVYEIGDHAFRGSYLPTLTIPDKVILIGEQAFANCGITHLTMGESVGVIWSWAFVGCSELASLTVQPKTPPILFGNDVFYNVPKDASVYVPCLSVPAYKSDAGWSYFSNYIGVVEDSTFVCDTVCYGEAYSGYGFNILHAAIGDYCRTVDCDSTICLNLFAHALPDKPIVTQNESTLISDSPIGNQWYLDNTPIPNATNQTHTYTKNGVYYVIVSNEHGCSAKSDTIKINDVGIMEVTKLQGYEVRSYEVYDMLGRCVASPNPSQTSAPLSFQGGEYSPFEGGRGMSGKAPSLLERAGGEAIIDISHLPAGIYVIKINTDKGIITRKIVKK